MLSNENGGGMVMPVAPYGNGMGNGFGGDWAWIILLLVLCGGWGGMGGFGGGFAGGMGLYPWMNQADITTSGFQNLALNNAVSDLNTAVVNGFAGVTNGFSQAEIAENSRQMANMNQMFALQSSLQNCCCENRAGLADLKYTVATEACADRAAVSNALRDVLAANTASTQRILDQMCQDKIDQKNDTISQLRQELLYARGQASQEAQTALLRAGQAATANQLVQELRDCPIPAMPVYGMTPIFNCGGNGGCGCGNF